MFLGELDGDGVALAGDAVAAAALELDRGWALDWGDPGAFPTPKRPRVLWLGLADAGPTIAAQAVLALKLSEAGLPVGDRAYRPHLTLARVRREVSTARSEELSQALSRFEHPPAARVASLVLFSSRLGGGRSPVYEELRSAALG
ncbi:MAG: 2,3-cyclic 3-phosphodiesterase [Chloroflexota bacterium]|nr:2,3-cyclic 3-phosphodiesterase [Chloroflexota bacterium]